MSTPVAWPSGPTAAANGRRVAPVPQPTSSTRSPGAAAAASSSIAAPSTLRASCAPPSPTQRGPATSFQYRRIAALAVSAVGLASLIASPAFPDGPVYPHPNPPPLVGE